MVAQLINLRQKSIQQPPLRTLISIIYSGCRKFGSKSSTGWFLFWFSPILMFYFLFLFVSWNVPSCRQVDRDCDFLEQERIMDYSLLVGLHFREASSKGSVTPKSRTPQGCPPTCYVSYLELLSGFIVSTWIIAEWMNLSFRKWRPWEWRTPYPF